MGMLQLASQIKRSKKKKKNKKERKIENIEKAKTQKTLQKEKKELLKNGLNLRIVLPGLGRKCLDFDYLHRKN